ncbi:MAG: 2-keto-4-pentenoate hydratase [Chromatiales bacterium]|nr:MAG: 2-keto-4-pentenoate hydratase [Chromatiales bacterium]
MSSLVKQNDAISRCLVDARLRAQALPDFPVHLPETLEQAYMIQTTSIERWPDEIAGWKVAKLSDADQARLHAERLVGPVFRSSVRTAEPQTSTVMPIYDGGFAAVEAEIVLRIGVTISPTEKVWSDQELIDAVAAAHCGAEIASSPMAVVNERGPTSIVSDFGNNGGVIVGPEITNWSERSPGFVTATVAVDDIVVGREPVDAIVGSPLQALRCLIKVSGYRGIQIPAGTLVSSGAITGVHDVQISSTARVDFGALGWFEVTFEPRAPLHHS